MCVTDGNSWHHGLLPLTQSEAKSACQAEQQQPPQLLQALLHGAEATALSQLLPRRPPVRHVHPAVYTAHVYTE